MGKDTLMLDRFLAKLSYKHPNWGISNLMYYISGGMLILFMCEYFYNTPLAYVPEYFMFDRALILQGQVWRIFTFIFMPESSISIILFAISLYFYIFIAGTLEQQWGKLRFNAYYLLGVIGCIIAGFITGYADNTYINLSLFLAFAALYPDFEVRLFFIIPLKMKYLAYIDLGIYGLTAVLAVISQDWATLLCIVFSLINLLLFFGGNYIRRIRDYLKHKARKAKFDRDMNRMNNPF